jgi:chemotaxis protein MotB
MKTRSSKVIVLIICTLSISLLSGCTNWKKKYNNLNVEYQNALGRLENKDRIIAENQKVLDDLQRKLAEGQKIGGFGDLETTVDAQKGTLTVKIPDTILFDSGKAALKKASISELNQVISTLKNDQMYAGKDIDVVGNTDSDPIKKSNWQDNWQLSTERALTVLRYMIDQGIAPDRVRAVGCGEAQPVAPNTSASGKSKNRRVEIVIHMR